jgi:general secretion pathway protein G
MAAERTRSKGFTLVELLVVLAILGLLVGLAVPQLFKYFSRAKTDAANVQIESIASGLDLFLLDVGRYPTDQEGLRALVEQPGNLTRWNGPYLSRPSILTDPWGQAYVYHVPGRNHTAYDLYTRGPDGSATGPPETAPAH